jgi:predicted permease
MSLWSRIANVFRNDRLIAEIDEELQTHLDESITNGRDPAEARRALGSMLRYREKSREIRLVPWLDATVSDARYAARQLYKHKVTTVAALLSLGVAIGGCVAAFRIVDALLLRPLPVREPESLYALTRSEAGPGDGPERSDGFAYPLFRMMREAAHTQAALMAISFVERVDLSNGFDGATEKVYRQYVSGGMFESFGLRPAIGRLLTDRDDQSPKAHPYAVISYDYWTRRFAQDAAVLGRSVRVADETFEIVGVVHQPFTGTEPGTMTDIFVPAIMHPGIDRVDWDWFRMFVRLDAESELPSVQGRLQAAYSTFNEATARSFAGRPQQSIDRLLRSKVSLVPAGTGASDMQSDYAAALAALSVLVGLVLLIATTNVANLLSARASSRSREMALRVSLGAARWRLLQLMTAEAAWLAGLATAIGIAFAWWTAPAIVGMVQPPETPARLRLPVDWRVFAFALMLALGITLLFIAGPALRAWSVTPLSALKGGEPRARRRGMHALVAIQMTFCVVVVFVSGLLLASFDRLSTQSTGFAAERILAIDVTAPRVDPEFWSQVAHQLAGLSGVDGVAMSTWPLLSGNTWNAFITIDQRPASLRPFFLTVSPGWFDVMRIPILEGRDLRPTETYPGVALVNEAFARQYYGGQSPVGKSFLETPSRGNALLQEATGTRYRVTIVGLVADARYRNLRDPVSPTVYVPFSAADAAGSREPISWGTFLVRTSADDPLSMAPIMRQAITGLRSDFRVSTIRTQASINEAHAVRERLLAILAVFFTGIAALLVGVGLWGVLHYSVLQYRREIGVRLALGAAVRDVVRCVSGGVLLSVLAGSALGLMLALAAQSYMQSLLYGVAPFEPWTLVSTASLISAVAIVAALPALRSAIRTQPAITLRSE